MTPPSPPPPPRPRPIAPPPQAVPRRRRRWLYALLALVLLGAAGVAAALVYARMMDTYKGYEEAERFVEIEPGMSVRAIGERLVAAGIVKDLTTYRLALWQSGQSRALKAGEYRFDRPMRPVEVIDKVARGEVHLRALTFPEGLTIPEMAAILERNGFGTAASFVEASRHAQLVAALDSKATDLEGYLFPDTYRLPRGATATTVVAAMVAGFERAFDSALREETVAKGVDIRALVALASLVEKETARAEERPLVASVYVNRLRLGMPLQCDPTVIYALQRAGRYTGNLTRADLAFDSPYNTYRYAGLPPGPIAAPGRASLEAALRPAQTDYLYFVSRNDGSHVFATTLREHNRNVQQYQVQYFRDRRRPRNPGGGRR